MINLMELNVNKTKNKFSLLIVLLSLAAVNCVSLPAPAAPVDVQAYKGKPQAEREKKYQESLIDSAGSGYKINGAQLTAQQIHPLFSAGYVSEPTRSLFNSHSRWETTGTIFGAVGGGFLGWMIGLQLNSGLSKRTKDSLGPGYFWGIGGGSLAIGIVCAVVASNKLTAASQSYNEDLYKALELQQKTSFNPIPHHEQYAHHSFAWSHQF